MHGSLLSEDEDARKGVLLVALILVLGIAFFRLTHEPGTGTDVSTSNPHQMASQITLSATH
ncbi:MAG TPA: hypothetical protein V6C72_17300 [Chroococcales cyanobacterium]